MLNWKVRIKNKNFWLTFIPAVLLLIQCVVHVFGIEIDFGELGNNLAEVVNSVFLVLTILGVVNDPTTAGFSDSYRAMTYRTPYSIEQDE